MTLLMGQKGENEFVVLTDSLTVTANDEPDLFSCKVHVLHDHDIVIISAGNALLPYMWQQWLRFQPIYNHAAINQFAPRVMSGFWAEICEAGGHSPGGDTVAVHHLTFEGNQAVMWTFDDENGFEPQRASDEPFQFQAPLFGQRYRPDRTMNPEAQQLIWSDFDEMLAIAQKIRADQDSLPEPRVHIGGELHLTTFTPGVVNTIRAHRFDDRDEMAMAIIRRRGISMPDGHVLRIDANGGWNVR